MGPRALAHLAFGALALLRSGSATLGVAPEDESKYSAATFRCVDGGGIAFPLSAVNDEFCQCDDGSDEPGTGACAGQDKTLFFCANEGSVAKRIYASRVGDSICDCCDGSDESSLAAHSGKFVCSNTCAEHGQEEKQELERRATTIRQGVEKQHEIRSQAAVERANWRWEIKRLEKDLPALETRLAEVKRLAAAMRADEVKVTDVVANTSSLDAEAGQSPGAADVDPVAVEGALAAQRHAQDSETDAAQPEEAKVSEYAKWMDGAESTLTKAAPPTEDDEEEDSAQATDEDSETYDDEDEEGGAFSSFGSGTATTVRGGSGLKKAEVLPLTGSSEEQSAQQAVNQNKAKSTELQNNLQAFDEEHLGYASLFDKTLSMPSGEHTYKLAFFKNAKQDHTSLGTWKGFTGPRSGEFSGGETCWQGPARSLKVQFECGLEASVQELYEPSRCVYAATVLHPGACDPTELETLKVENRVIGPKDEL